MAEWHSVQLGVRFRLGGINYLIYSFHPSSNLKKRGVEFRHSKRNVRKFDRKYGTECVNTIFSLPILHCYMRDTARSYIKIH